MDVYDTYEKPTEHGYQKLTVYYDTDPMNPREYSEPLGFMVCLHSRYNLGDKHDFRDSEDIHEYLRINGIKSVLPLYLYEHSGITINTGGFSCSWDSGQIGYIWIEDYRIREIFKVKRISQKLRLSVLEYLESEVNAFDQYLTGDCYRYEVTEYTRINPNGDLREKDIDSCGGFYGSDFEDNGLFEYADFMGVLD